MTTKPPPKAKVQPDDVPVGMMAGLLAALTLVVLGTLLVVWQVFGDKADQVIKEQFLAKPDKVLKRVSDRDQKTIAGYGVVDAKRGIYRIPVGRAMQLLLSNTKLLAPAPKPIQAKKADAKATSAATATKPGAAARPAAETPAQGQAKQAQAKPAAKTAAKADDAAATKPEPTK